MVVTEAQLSKVLLVVKMVGVMVAGKLVDLFDHQNQWSKFYSTLGVAQMHCCWTHLNVFGLARVNLRGS